MRAQAHKAVGCWEWCLPICLRGRRFQVVRLSLIPHQAAGVCVFVVGGELNCQKVLCDSKDTGEVRRRISSLCEPIIQMGRWVAISGSLMPWLWPFEVHKLLWRSENVILLESKLPESLSGIQSEEKWSRRAWPLRF